MPLTYLGRAQGFGSRTYTEVPSPVTQRLIYEDLKEFTSESVTRPANSLLDLGIHRTYDLFKLPERQNVIHLNDIFSLDLNIWTKSPGLPWINMGYATNGDIRDDPDAVRRVRKFAYLVKEGKKIEAPDCLAFVRSHVCDEGETKVRAVWDYPATLLFCEAMFAIPLIEAYERADSRVTTIAYGLETATGGARRVYNRFLGKGKTFVGLDFKKFDKTVPAWLIEIAFDIIMPNLYFHKYRDYGYAHVTKILVLFYFLRNYFINTKIRLSNGRRYRKSSGIASGSYFTQLVGSIVNCILVNWASLEMTGRFPSDLLVLGDNSLACVSHWSLEECSKLFSLIGMTLNLEKSQVRTSLDIDLVPWI